MAHTVTCISCTACRVLCAGFSLGAALATLCGPWAKVTFPNVSSPQCPPSSTNVHPLLSCA